MSAFGQPGLNPGYGSKRRQAVLQSQGQLDPYGNQVRQAMQPAQGFAAYSQRPPQQQAPRRQAPQQRVASGGGFGAYAPQPAAQPASRPATMGTAQPTPPQGAQYRPDGWSPPSDPEGYKRFMQARSAERSALIAEGDRANLEQWVLRPNTGSESMTEEQLRAAIQSFEARKLAAGAANYAQLSKTPEYRARAAQTRAREEAVRAATRRQQEEYWSPANQERMRKEREASAKERADHAYRLNVSRLLATSDIAQVPDDWIRDAHKKMAERPDLFPGQDILGVHVDKLQLPPEYQRTWNQREGGVWSATPNRLPAAR